MNTMVYFVQAIEIVDSLFVLLLHNTRLNRVFELYSQSYGRGANGETCGTHKNFNHSFVYLLVVARSTAVHTRVETNGDFSRSGERASMLEMDEIP
jgi:hypothetical protein